MDKKIFIWALIAVLLVTTVSAQQMNDTIMSAWKNDTDVCAGIDLAEHDGVAHTASSGCMDGDCYTFDGSDDALFVDDYNIPGSSAFTWSYWGNSTDLRAVQTTGHYVTWADGGAAEALNHFWASGDLGYMQIDPAASTSFQEGNTTDMQHWVVTVNDTSGLWILYLNSVQIKNASFGAGNMNHYNGNNDLWIGNRDPGVGGDEAFKGVIDEVYVWNRSLTQSEINDLYNGGSGTFINDDCEWNVTAPPPAGRVITQTSPSSFNETDNLLFRLNITDPIINNTREHNASLEFNASDFIAIIDYNATGVIIFNVTVNTTLLDINNTVFSFNWTFNLTQNDQRVWNQTAPDTTTGVWAYGAINYTIVATTSETLSQPIYFNLFRFNTSVDYITQLYFNNSLRRTNTSLTSNSYNNTLITPLINTDATIPNINITTNLSFTYAGKTVIRTISLNQSVNTIRLVNFTVPPNKAETEQQGVSFNLVSLNATFGNYTIYHNVTNVFENLTPTSGTYWNNSFFTPLISGNPSTILVNLTTNYTLIFDNNITTRTSVQKTQNVSSINVTNCTLASNPEIITLFKDEENPTQNLSTALEATFTTWASNRSINQTNSFDLTGFAEYGFCFAYAAGNFYVETTKIYTSSDMVSRTWHFVNASFDAGDSTNVTMLHLNSSLSTNVIVTIVDENNDPLEGWFVDVQRYYPSEDVLRSTQISKTSNNGEAIIKLVTIDEFYSIIVKDTGGRVRTVTDPAKITDTTLTIQVNLIDPFVDVLRQVDAITYTLTYNNNTGIATYFFSDTNNLAASGRVLGTRLTPRGLEILCQNQVSSTSGTLYCDTNNATGDLQFQGFITTNSGQENLITDISTFSASIPFGTLGLILYVILGFVTAVVGIFNPIAAVFFGTIGLIGGVVIGLIDLSYGAVMLVVVIAGVVIFRMKA